MSRAGFAAAVVWAHLAAVLVHAAAHGALGVGVPGAADALFIAAAVYVGPVAALLLLRRGRRRTAAALLAASMAGALVYGIAYHFVLWTPDHVAHAPPTVWGGAFRNTALAIALLELTGTFAGVRLWAKAPGSNPVVKTLRA